MKVGDIAWKLSKEDAELVTMISKSYKNMYVAPLSDRYSYLLENNDLIKIWSVPTSSDEFPGVSAFS